MDKEIMTEEEARKILFAALEAGMEDIRQGRVIPIDEVFDEMHALMESKRSNQKLVEPPNAKESEALARLNLLNTRT